MTMTNDKAVPETMSKDHHAADDDDAASTGSYAQFLKTLQSPTPAPAAAAEEETRAPPAADAATASSSGGGKKAAAPAPEEERSGCERVGDRVDETIAGVFGRVGRFCASRPRITIAATLTIAVACAMGMAKLDTENRPEKVRPSALCRKAS